MLRLVSDWQRSGRQQFQHIDRLGLVLVSFWTVTMISLPIFRWIFGPKALMVGTVVGVLVQVVVVAYFLARPTAWGFSQTLIVSIMVVGLAWLAEALGSSTGVPFGKYAYTPTLQPQILGVPLLIPLAWLMMLPPAWAVARAALPRLDIHGKIQQRLVFSGVASLAFTAWDLTLDPQMVAWNFWSWEHPGGYFGIPWVNFLGWIMVSWIITFIIFSLLDSQAGVRLPVMPLLLVYAITWALETIGLLFFWGLPGPALAGFVGMGFMLLWALTGLRQANPTENGIAMTGLIWFAIGFACGSLPFSVWLSRLATGRDAREFGDGNPGATNALRAGGWRLGVVVYFLDFFKAALPVGLARYVFQIQGFDLFLASCGPVLGHAFSPFLGWRGGKGLATMLGAWIGLTILTLPGAVLPAAILVMLIFWSLIIEPDGWSVLFTALGLLFLVIVLHPQPYAVLVAVTLFQIVLVVWKHRLDLRLKPKLKPRMRAWLGIKS